jgi:DNA-binding HxlR family transcriptional regulator
VLGVFTTKWTTLILYQLSSQPLRHSQLQTQIQGASQKMLTSTLRSLERDGLIRREVKQAMPPHVEYSLTPLGASLIPILDTMKAWAESNFDEVVQSRQDYDFG